MWFRKKRVQPSAKQEVKALKINSDTIQKLEKATESTRKLNELLDSDGGITQLIFLATGGDRRMKR